MNIPNILAIGSLGNMEMLIILLVVLLLFGAKKLPELARGIGKSMGEFKRARNDFESEISRAADDAERLAEQKKRDDERMRAEAAATAAASAAAAPGNPSEKAHHS